MTDPTRKRWSPETLAKFNGTRDGTGFVFPNGERYDPDADPKMDAPKGGTRGLWPAPADVPGETVLLVEGGPDVWSAWNPGSAAVPAPTARTRRAGEAERTPASRRSTSAAADCAPPQKPG